MQAFSEVFIGINLLYVDKNRLFVDKNRVKSSAGLQPAGLTKL